MKRERSDDVHSIAMANYLMLLSEAAATFSSSSSTASTGRVFVCKACNRQFSSFQALGGHRASHKKPRTMAGEDSNSDDLLQGSSSSLAKPKTHECSICGSEFAIGQALGGHMRRHRAQTSHNNKSNNDNSSSSVEFDSDATKKNKSKRVLFLDLNLTPLENDLEILGIGTSSPLLVTL